MNNKLLELITPPSKKDPWLQVLESQAKNIMLSGGVALGVVSSQKEQPMTGCVDVDNWNCVRYQGGWCNSTLVSRESANVLGSDLLNNN